MINLVDACSRGFSVAIINASTILRSYNPSESILLCKYLFVTFTFVLQNPNIVTGQDKDTKLVIYVYHLT